MSELKPEDKASAVKKLQTGKQGACGDGRRRHQRCPALAQADVGMALGTGTDIAMETADLTLMHGDLRAIPDAIRLGQATATDHQAESFLGVFLQCVVNSYCRGVCFLCRCFLPSMLRELHPMLAAFAMAFSSVSVVLNSLRLQWWRNSPF